MTLEDFGIYTYEVRLAHDSGEITLTTMASSEAHAIRTILTIERAPRSAILSVKKA
jgi:hypothetical protein